MNLTDRHRRVVRTIWKCGGRIDEAAVVAGVRGNTIRRWLGDAKFRALLMQESMEPLLQATSAVMRWAPAAVARLIRDLDGGSPADARHAAREILKLAMGTQTELCARKPAAAGEETGEDAAADDAYSRRFADLPDDRLKQMLEILNGNGPGSQAAPR